MQLACLRAVDVHELVDVALGQNSPLWPVVDGALVHSAPAVALLAGDFNRDAGIVVSEMLFEGDHLLFDYSQTVTMNASQYASAAAAFGAQVRLQACARIRLLAPPPVAP
jgi:hypothetical protein